MSIFAVPFMLSMLAACGGNGNDSHRGENSASEIVRVAKLTASQREDSLPAKAPLMAIRAYEAAGEETGQDAEMQYTVVQMPNQEISFTITLDNQEASGIDAVRLYCDDPAAEVKIDGEYKKIAQESDGTRVVNWASEDAYEKTYSIKLSSEEYVNSLEVKDIRLAGHSKFQSKETEVKNLGKNELKVYKMSEDDLKWNFVTNTTEYYAWNFTHSDKVSNVTVEGIEADENGEYRVTENGTIKYSYDLTVEGTTVRWSGAKDIELLKIEKTDPKYLYWAFTVFITISGSETENIHELEFYQMENENYVLKFTAPFFGESNGGIGWRFEGRSDIDGRINESSPLFVKIFDRYYLLGFKNI